MLMTVSCIMIIIEYINVKKVLKRNLIFKKLVHIKQTTHEQL